jgi:hypothetical protein
VEGFRSCRHFGGARGAYIRVPLWLMEWSERWILPAQEAVEVAAKPARRARRCESDLQPPLIPHHLNGFGFLNDTSTRGQRPAVMTAPPAAAAEFSRYEYPKLGLANGRLYHLYTSAMPLFGT